MADTGGPTRQSSFEARVARLEGAHIRGDLGEVKSALNRLAPRIDEMHGFLTARLPELATKAVLIQLGLETWTGLADLRTELKIEAADLRAKLETEVADLRAETAGLRTEIMRCPIRHQSIFADIGLIGAVLAIATHFAH